MSKIPSNDVFDLLHLIAELERFDKLYPRSYNVTE
jgi:hypothetical protein